MSTDLGTWTDWDIALFDLGVATGLVPAPAPEDPDRWGGHKWVVWSANPTAELFQGLLDQMVRAGVLERREEPDVQYRRRPSWVLGKADTGTVQSERARDGKELNLHAIRDRHLRLEQMRSRSFHTGNIEMDLADCVGEIEMLRSVSALDTAMYKVVLSERNAERALNAALKMELEQVSAQKDGAYAERNKLVALVSKVFPACLGRHEESATDWEEDWRWIVYVTLPTGQCSWHIHDSDLPLFAHLRREDVAWDGHTTDEKYARIAAFTGRGER